MPHPVSLLAVARVVIDRLTVFIVGHVPVVANLTAICVLLDMQVHWAGIGTRAHHFSPDPLVMRLRPIVNLCIFLERADVRLVSGSPILRGLWGLREVKVILLLRVHVHVEAFVVCGGLLDKHSNLCTRQCGNAFHSTWVNLPGGCSFPWTSHSG